MYINISIFFNFIDKSDDKGYRTEDNTWTPFAGFRGTTLQSNPSHYNHTSYNRGHFSRSEYNKTMSPTVGSTWKPFATSSNSPWIPMWTTPKPFYDRPEHTINYHSDYGHAYGQNRHQDRPIHPEWKPSSGNLGQSSDSKYGFQDSDRQWAENHKTNQNAQQSYHFVRPEGSWSYEHRNQDHRHGYYPPGYHYHHHHHHYHNYRPMPNSPVNPSWNSGSSTASIDDQKYDQGYAPNTDDGHWHSDHDHHYDSGHYDHHYSEHAASSEIDQRQFQSHVPPKEIEDNIQFHNKHNETKFFGTAEGNLPTAQRIDLSPNRQDYRKNSRFYHPSFNHTFPPTGNILLNNSNKFAEDWNQSETQQGSLSPWVEQENTAWNQPNRSSSFKPRTWHDQQNQQVQPEIQTRPWDQSK